MNADRRTLLAAALDMGAAPARAEDADFERAMQDHEQARHAAAFDALARLADAGHPNAAPQATRLGAAGTGVQR